jgi:hypothetical protein
MEYWSVLKKINPFADTPTLQKLETLAVTILLILKKYRPCVKVVSIRSNVTVKSKPKESEGFSRQ